MLYDCQLYIFEIDKLNYKKINRFYKECGLNKFFMRFAF